jgi:glutamate dehydrogenase (NADP+)
VAADFEPKGKSDGEVMRFCQSFMAELFRHIGADTDVPEGDIGVGSREIGYCWHVSKIETIKFTGVLTGKGLGLGRQPDPARSGRLRLRLFRSRKMLATRSDRLSGKTCLVSGSGNVAQATTQKLLEMGAKVLTMSDSSGHIYDDQGIDAEKLALRQAPEKYSAGQDQ